jgi:hypothetical protein
MVTVDLGDVLARVRERCRGTGGPLAAPAIPAEIEHAGARRGIALPARLRLVDTEVAGGGIAVASLPGAGTRLRSPEGEGPVGAGEARRSPSHPCPDRLGGRRLPMGGGEPPRCPGGRWGGRRD